MPLTSLTRAAPWGAFIGGVEVTIRESNADQVRMNSSALRRREHISLHPDLMTQWGHKSLRQVRVVLSTGETRVMTVELPYPDEEGMYGARMNADAYARFGVSVGEVTATIYSNAAVDNTLSEAQAEAIGDHIEFLTDNGTDAGLWCVAPHAGKIEPWTDDQAEYTYTQLKAAGKQVTLWGTKGWTINSQSASNRWHTTATDFHPDSYPLLAGPWARTFSHGVAFHGYTGVMTIELGGLADLADRNTLKAALEAAIPGVTVNTGGIHDDIDGDSPRNVMNRMVPGNHTLQLEQSYDVRRDYWQDVADVVIAYFTPLL